MNGEESLIGILIWGGIADRSRMNANIVAWNPGQKRSVGSHSPVFDVGLKKICVIQQEARIMPISPGLCEVCTQTRAAMPTAKVDGEYPLFSFHLSCCVTGPWPTR